jgi:MOSC domain-containing protein YiiM
MNSSSTDGRASRVDRQATGGLKGTVVSLQLCPGHRKPMNRVEEAEAIEDLGLKGDRHALPQSSRQVLLIERETLFELGIGPGVVKENITTEGIDLMSLPGKSRLQVGSGTILEITKSCSPCSRMEEIRPGFMKEITGRRGMLTRVIKGGRIRVGDEIRVVS